MRSSPFPEGRERSEEITEVMSKVSLKHIDAPCILYNLDGILRQSALIA